MSASPASPEIDGWQRYGHLAVVYLVWGSTYLAVKICVSGPTGLPPIQLQTWRVWCASLVLLGIAAFTGGIPRRLGWRDGFTCAATGILMWVFGNGLATVASRHAASGFIVMTMGIIPVWTTLIDSLIARRIPGRATLAGILLGVIGMGFIVIPPVLTSGASVVEPGYAPWAAVVLCLGGLTWSLGSILQRPLQRRLTPAASAGFQMLSAAIVLTIMAKAGGNDLVPATLPAGRQIVAFIYLVVFGSALCLISYIRVIRSFSPAVASTFAYVNPIVGIALGWLLLGEVPLPWAVPGMLLVLLGVFLVITRRKA